MTMFTHAFNYRIPSILDRGDKRLNISIINTGKDLIFIEIYILPLSYKIK